MKEFKGTPAPWNARYIRLCHRDSPCMSGKPTRHSYEFRVDFLSHIDMEHEEGEANAKLITQAPKMLEHGEKLNELIKKAQSIIVEYLVPDGIDEAVAMDLLVELFDCPEQHAAQTNWEETVNKAVGGSND